MLHVRTIEGQMQANDQKFTIIASRFNDFIVDRLIGGAVDYLLRHGADRENITLIRVPGAFEMPLVAQKVARSGKADAIVCLGAVIRGATLISTMCAAKRPRASRMCPWTPASPSALAC